MRRALWREAKADVLSRPWQTLLLLIVVLIGAAGIVAGLGQRQSAASQWDGAVSRANGPDIAIYGTNVAVLQHIAASPSVRQAAPLIPVTYDTNIVLGGPKIQLPLRGTASEPPVGRPLIEAGRWLSPTSAASNEIVLERSFSLAEGIAVGDRITIGGPGGTRAFRVVGETVDTLDCFYPQCGSQFGYVTPATLDSMAPVASGQRHYLLSMNLHDRAAVGSFESETFARYGSTLLGVNDWQTTRNNALILNGFFAAFMGAFAIVLLLTAAVVIASTVMARVLDPLP